MASATPAWPERLPALALLDQGLKSDIVRATSVVRLPAGTTVFHEGATPQGFIILLAGQVRVQHVSPQGREIVLYRIAAGESCILTTACLLADSSYAATAIAETEAQAAVMSKAAFDRLLAQSSAFRKFVFDGYGQRLVDLLGVVDGISTARIEGRLVRRLLAMAEDGTVKATHQRLAAELGTAREVVSRHLEALHKAGLIESRRGAITLLDLRKLKALAAAG